MIDLHCHILPGLDDGADSLDTTVQMCRMAELDGITNIIATPHFLDGRHTPDLDLRDRYILTINAALQDNGFQLRLHAGAEVHLVPELADILRAQPELRLAASQYVLVELPAVFPVSLQDELFQLRLIGLTPILAHVERYDAIQREPDLLIPLIQSGILTQITVQSLCGDCGEACRICAETVVRCNTAHFLATDAHSLHRRPPIMSRARPRIADLVGDAMWDDMTRIRPQAILDNASINVPEPRPVRCLPMPSLLHRLTAWL